MDWFLVEKNQSAKEYLQHAVSSKNERDIRKDTVVWKKFEKGNEAETIYLWVTDGLGVEGGETGTSGMGKRWQHFSEHTFCACLISEQHYIHISK